MISTGQPNLHPTDPALAQVAAIVLAKFPQPGRAKTRLIPAIGAEGAAKVQACFLRHVLKRLARMNPAERVVCFDPPDKLDAMRELLEDDRSLRLLPQVNGDLGRRIAGALGVVGRAHRRSLLLAVDSPDVPVAHLAACAQATSDAQVVLGLADDGGYWCIGVRDDVDTAALLHQGIEWSSQRTAADTIARAKALGYTTWAGHTWDDVDQPADLVRVMRRLERSADADDRALHAALMDLLPCEFLQSTTSHLT